MDVATATPLFKKRSSKAKSSIRKRPATPPPDAQHDSDSDSDAYSSPDETGRQIKRQKKATTVTASSTRTAQKSAVDIEPTKFAGDRSATITDSNDATKQSNWYDSSQTDDLSAKALLGKTRAPPPDEDADTSGTYKGASSYTSFIRKNPNAPDRGFGPMKASSNVRTITTTDFAPDVCKDYKQTGFCGFGDGCKYLHAREDYKHGWELDKDWEIGTKGKKKLKGTTMASANRGDDADDEDREDAELANIPFACIICKKPYKNPIITKCNHYFCESCALQRYRKTPTCAACGEGTGGVFNVAKNLKRLLEKKRERAERRKAKAQEEGLELTDEEDEEGTPILDPRCKQHAPNLPHREEGEHDLACSSLSSETWLAGPSSAGSPRTRGFPPAAAIVKQHAMAEQQASTRPIASSGTSTHASKPVHPHVSTDAGIVYSSNSEKSPTDAHERRRPLIDLATNERRNKLPVDTTMEDRNESTFPADPYPQSLSSMGMPLRMPPWVPLWARSHLRPRRIPRRLPRMLFYYTSMILAFVATYVFVISPAWQEHNALERSLTGDMKYGRFGANIMPTFEDMTQLKTLDSKFLPGKKKGQEKRRLVVVGDVHGRKDELTGLLEKAKFDKRTDHLIFTGDMITKGPSSSDVVDMARDLGASCVRGNHEDRILLAHKSLAKSKPPPPESGTELDIAKYKLLQDLLEEAASAHGTPDERELARSLGTARVGWLRECPVILRVGPVGGFGEVVVVHAGLVPEVELEHQDPFLAMNMRTIDLETRAPSEGSKGIPWYKLWNHHQLKLQPEERTTVIYGHDAKRGLRLHAHSKGLDTGCVYGGRLSALVLELDEQGDAMANVVDVKCPR